MAEVIAKETARIGGRRSLVTKGQVYDSSDPVVKQYPHLFEAPEDNRKRTTRPTSTAELGERSMSAPVERATAAPGEKRSVRKPKAS